MPEGAPSLHRAAVLDCKQAAPQAGTSEPAAQVSSPPSSSPNATCSNTYRWQLPMGLGSSQKQLLRVKLSV